jgi:GNAT superfamily N-acetyltransferase
MGNLIFRPLDRQNLEDYQALSELFEYAYPEEKTTALALKIADNLRPAKFICRRWLAEQDGVIKGVAGFEHWAEFYQPDKYLLHLIVAPQFQQQGIGTFLYQNLMNELEKVQPQSARIWAQKEREPSVKFAERRGFTKVKVKWNIILDLPSCNVEHFLPQVEIVRQEGTEVKPIAQLTDDPERDRKLHNLYVRTLRGIENVDEVQIADFETFAQSLPTMNQELYFVAVKDGDYIAMWQLETAASNTLFGGILGVDEEYRQRGVAIALVVQSIAYAKSYRYSKLIAYTAEYNKPTLTLAEKMGFTHLPAQVLFSKEFVTKTA